VAPSDDEPRSGLGEAAGRAAFYPARAAARAWRDQLEAAVDDVLSAPELARVLDRALAGPLPEELARSLVRHRVLERVVAELSASGELDRLLAAALASPRTVELTDHVLASEETRRAVRHVASSPEVREAIARQTTGVAEEVVGGLRDSAVALDRRLEAVVHRRAPTGTTPYAGLATRGLAFATDAVLALGIYLALVGVGALAASLVGELRPEWLVGLLVGSGWLLVAGSYFVLFWSTAGQTPGMRLLRLRVATATGRPPTPGRSVLRLVGLALAIVPLFAGFVPILFDRRRRGLADFVAGTVVLYDEHAAVTAGPALGTHPPGSR
jgi:uncharacterized RDD family membrane protein YckC